MIAARRHDRSPIARVGTGAPVPLVSDRVWLRPLLVVFAIKGALLVAIVSPFTGHDEVDHFYYIAQLARGDGLGVVGEDPLPRSAEPYRNYVADYPTNAEVIQPPLYHAAVVPLYWVAPRGDLAKLYALRGVSVVLGLVVVWLAYRTARLLFPTDPLLRAGVPLFVAWQPQFSFEAAIVNHDILVIVLFSLVLEQLLRALRDGLTRRRAIAIGLWSAAGLWTKMSFGLIFPVTIFVVWVLWRDRRASWRAGAHQIGWTVGLPLLLAVPWFVRSFALYGDPTGARRLSEIPEYGERASSYREMLFSAPFWRDRLHDFWANYGWRQVPFDPREYRLILAATVLAGATLALFLAWAVLRGWRGRPVLTRFQWRGLATLALATVMLTYGVLYVGTLQFTQSRFVFPAMVAIAVLSLVGVSGLLPARWRPAALPLLLAALVALNVLTALRYLIPFYYGPGGSVAP